jgi:hypothetical protein
LRRATPSTQPTGTRRSARTGRRVIKAIPNANLHVQGDHACEVTSRSVRDGCCRAPRYHPNGPGNAGRRRLGSYAEAQGQSANPRHPHHRPLRPDPLGSPMAILFPPGGPPRPCNKKPRSSRPYRPASRSTGSPSMHRWPVPPRKKSASKGGVDSQNEGEKNVEISNYVTSPPSENSQHLTDFQGTLEPARDFGLERRKIAASRPGELIIEEAR